DDGNVAAGALEVFDERLAVGVVDRRCWLVGDRVAALLHAAHPGDVFGAADGFVEGEYLPERSAEGAVGIREEGAVFEQPGLVAEDSGKAHAGQLEDGGVLSRQLL